MADVIGATSNADPLSCKSDEQLGSEDNCQERLPISEPGETSLKMTKSELQQSPENELQLQNSEKTDVKNNQTSVESPTCETSDGATDLFVSNSELSSSASTPVPPEPFQPKFKITISPNDVTKDGDYIKYTILSERLDADGEKVNSVWRTYEDFQWLNHSLSTGSNVYGIIIPPLPPRVPTAVEKSKKQLGSTAKTLLKDEFGKDCQKLQKYLNMLAKHHMFGADETFDIFLMNKDTPVHTNVRKGLFDKLSSAMKNRKFSSESDCDEFFSQERQRVDDSSALMKASNDAFNKMVSSQMRLCEVLNHLSTAFMLCTGSNNDPITNQSNKLNNLFSRGIKDTKDALETLSINDETTLGSFLDLYSDYLDSEKEMLFRRTSLMIEYENSNRALDKVKSNPVKYEQAVEHKKEAELNFEQCSDVARQEIKRFHRERVYEFQQSLVSFSEARLRNARDTCTLLTATMSQLKQLKIPTEISEAEADPKPVQI